MFIGAAVVIGAGILAYMTTRPTIVPDGTMATTTAGIMSVRTGGTYSDPSGFSIDLPPGYAARAVNEEGSETLFIEGGTAEPGTSAKRFQFYITPYDEPASQFNTARIYKDLPNAITRNAREFTIAGGHGVEFDDDAGHEIWFAAAGQLYQVTAPRDQVAVAEHVVASFKLK